MKIVKSCSLALVLSAGNLCVAQITAPPPATPVVPDEFKPSTPLVEPTPEIISVPTKPKGPTPAPDVPYKRLAELDPATGQFKPLSEPAEWVAVRTNPLITAEMWVKFEPFLAARRAKYEVIVVQNLKAIDQVRGGIMDTANPGRKEEFGGIVGLVKPLTTPNAPAALASALQSAALISPEQAALSRKMANEYAFEVAAGPERIKAGKKPDAEKAMVEVLKQRLEEPQFVYRQMRIEASRSIDKLLAAAVKDEAALKQAMSVAGKITADTSDDERASIMDEMEKGLSVEVRQAIYQALLDNRPK